MVLRKIVRIDEDLCDGCGQCIPGCAEGALQIIDGKARLISDAYCDGLGACLGHCPQGAITIEERETDPFDEEAVKAHLSEQQALECGCPSAAVQIVEAPASPPGPSGKSALRQWPVKLRLTPVTAPFFDHAHLLVAADCVPFAYPGLHSLLAGRSVVIGCPKFDDARGYAEKLGEILRRNDVESVTVVNMEVPCCHGLRWVVDRAVEASGRRIPVRRHVVTVKGTLQEAER